MTQKLVGAASPATSPTLLRKSNKTHSLKSNRQDSGTVSSKNTFIIGRSLSDEERGSSCNFNENNSIRINSNIVNDKRSTSKPQTTRGVSEVLNTKMASQMSFADWRQSSNENLMTTAETLIDNLEDIADILVEIDDKYIAVSSASSQI